MNTMLPLNAVIRSEIRSLRVCGEEAASRRAISSTESVMWSRSRAKSERARRGTRVRAPRSRGVASGDAPAGLCDASIVAHRRTPPRQPYEWRAHLHLVACFPCRLAFSRRRVAAHRLRCDPCHDQDSIRL